VPLTLPYQPRLGDVGLTRISGSVGLGIRVAEFLNGDGWAGDIEHAFGIVGFDEPSVTWIVEAEPGGARKTTLHYPADQIEWIPCPDEFREAMARELLRLVGTPYSFLDYGACACHRLHLPVPGLREYIEDTGHCMCSQLMDLAASRAGWHFFGSLAVPPSEPVWDGYATPRMLRRLVPPELQLAHVKR
jgi:hypothetical protein